MEQFTYESAQGRNFLTCRLDRGTGDPAVLGKITTVRIPGFLPAYAAQSDPELIRYEITSCITLKKMLEAQIAKRQLLGIFRGITQAFLSAQEYGIPDECLLLENNYIFVSTAGRGIGFACLPVRTGVRRKPNLPVFLKNLLYNAYLSPDEDNSYALQLMNFLNDETSFTVAKLAAYLQQGGGAAAPAAAPAPAPAAAPAGIPTPPPAAPTPPPAPAYAPTPAYDSVPEPEYASAAAYDSTPAPGYAQMPDSAPAYASSPAPAYNPAPEYNATPASAPAPIPASEPVMQAAPEAPQQAYSPQEPPRLNLEIHPQQPGYRGDNFAIPGQ